jgi:hypothetical protein
MTSQQPENCENRNDPDLVQAFLKKWWVESDFKAPNLPLSLRLKGSGCHTINPLQPYSSTLVHIHNKNKYSFNSRNVALSRKSNLGIDIGHIQAFLKKWWVESDFKAPNLPLSLRLKVSGCHYNSRIFI